MSKESTHQTGLQMLERLRQEPFNVETERKLEQHKYIEAAEHGALSIGQLRAFAHEQFSIQRSDAISFASLAGHVGFHPLTLTGTKPPEGNADDLFHFLLGGEIYASSLLLQHAKSLGIETEECLGSYACSAKAQGYPSYWARLALANQRAAGAAACAVNFPAWGRMCGKLADALKDKYEMNEESLAFIQFFASPIENLDAMAAKVMDDANVSYEELLEPVRLLQAYEVLFWDACYEADHTLYVCT